MSDSSPPPPRSFLMSLAWEESNCGASSKVECLFVEPNTSYVSVPSDRRYFRSNVP